MSGPICFPENAGHLLEVNLLDNWLDCDILKNVFTNT